MRMIDIEFDEVSAQTARQSNLLTTMDGSMRSLYDVGSFQTTGFSIEDEEALPVTAQRYSFDGDACNEARMY